MLFVLTYNESRAICCDMTVTVISKCFLFCCPLQRLRLRSEDEYLHSIFGGRRVLCQTCSRNLKSIWLSYVKIKQDIFKTKTDCCIHQWTWCIIQSLRLHQERGNLTHQTLPSTHRVWGENPGTFQPINIYKRNFKVIQSDPLSNGFTEIFKDVRKIRPEARGHRALAQSSTSTLIPHCMEIFIWDKNDTVSSASSAKHTAQILFEQIHI